jgi:membrane associated rhomboid family serine protease
MSVNLIIVIITCAVSYFGFNNPDLFHKFKHYPYQEQRDKSYYRFLTAGFLHANWMHLLINMFVLYGFGGYVESYFTYEFGLMGGRLIYLLFYLTVIVLANTPTFLKKQGNPGFASIGASGAVSGVIFIYILLNPWDKIYLYGILGIYSIIAGIVYLIYSTWASRQANDRIDHDAHFYGAVFGIILVAILRPSILSIFINRLSDVPF